MSKFKSCVKKEISETLRTKNFYIILATSVLFSVLAIVYILIMSFIKDYLPFDSTDFLMFFQKTYAASLRYYMAFMTTYYLIILTIFFCSSISKQIKEKKWILPLNAGIKTKHLIGAKLLVSTVSVVICIIASALLHLLLTVLICSPSGLALKDLILAYVFLIIFVVFILILTITLNAITKTRWAPILITLTSIMLFPSLLDLIMVNGAGLASYTPFAFYNLAMMPTEIYAYSLPQILSSSLSLVAIAIGFVIWALNMKKAK